MEANGEKEKGYLLAWPRYSIGNTSYLVDRYMFAFYFFLSEKIPVRMII